MKRKQRTNAEEKAAETARPRFSSYLPRELITKLKRAAVEKRVPLADVMEEAVSQYIAREEKKLGQPFKPIAELRAGRPLREE
jgi:predicted transcriptional regulator